MALSRNYVFTLNNYEEIEVLFIKSLRPIRYIGFGKEISNSGTPHLQGMVCFNSAKTLPQAIKLLPSRAHVEIMRGNVEQAWVYCSKDGDYWDSGTRPRSPTEVGVLNSERYRTFLEHARNGDRENVDPRMLVQYYSVFERIAGQNLIMPTNLDSVCGIWIHGLPGCGKSHAVNAAYPLAYRKMANKWWDSYQEQEVVWLDDLDPDATTWVARFLKVWADKWSFMAEVKGSSRCIRPRKFIVTSNYSIDNMGFRGQDLAAIKRRFIEIEKTLSQNIII